MDDESNSVLLGSAVVKPPTPYTEEYFKASLSMGYGVHFYT